MATSRLMFSAILEVKKSTEGKWKKIFCLTDCYTKFYNENENSYTDSCGTITTADRSVDFGFKIAKVLSKDSLENLLGTPTTEITSGVKAISYTEKVKLDKIFVVPEKSNDGAGVTNLVITKDGVDLVLDTDYSVEVLNDETTITFITVNAGDEVVITGDVNVNTGRSINPKLGNHIKERIDVRFTAIEEIEGANYNFLLEGKKGSNQSEYILKFFNTKGSTFEGIEQVIKFDEGDINMIDEITPKLETLEV